MAGKKYLLFFIGILIILPFISADVINISECGGTYSSGVYELNQSITGTATCLTLNGSNTEIDCKGNSILYGGDGIDGKVGIDAVFGVTQLRNITIKNCIIQDTNKLGATGYGIRMQRVQDSYLFNNTIQTNGTTASYGLYFLVGCDGNVIENNTINGLGNMTANYGFYLSTQSNNNVIKNNIITGTGTGTSHALYLLYSDNNTIKDNSLSGYSTFVDTSDSDVYSVFISTGSKSNLVRNNYLYTQATADNFNVYIYLNSNYNKIINNTIFANGTADGNYGAYILGSAYNEIINNTISTYGSTTGYGIRIGAGTYNNLVDNNFISTNGTSASTANYGIYLDGSTYGNITKNIIFTNGFTGNNGIHLAAGSGFNNILDNNISTYGSATSTTTGNNGIYLTRTVDNNIIGNQIFADGTTSSATTTVGNNGINLYQSAGYNYVYNNTIQTNGISVNYGIFLTTANRNVILNNQISTNGSAATNHGIYLFTSANNNEILYNNISTYGTSLNHGVSLSTSSDNNIIIGNNIITNGSLTTTTTSNYGISMTSSCYNNLAENNTLVTNGQGRYNYGLSLLVNSNYNILRGNKVTTNGAGIINAGAFISESRENTIENNVISTSGSTTAHGIELTSASKRNLIKRNNISTSGGGTSYGIYLLFVTPNYPDDNTFQENNFISVDGTEIRINTANIIDTWLVNQNLNSYYFANSPGNTVHVKNSSAGEIKFLGAFTGSGTGFSDKIYVNENYAFITTSVAELNKPAEITIYNRSTTQTNLSIYRDGVLCSSDICTNLTSMQAGNVTFNVTGGGGYSINASDEIPHVINLISPENNTNITTQDYNFVFTVTDETSSLFNCHVYIDGILYGSNDSVQDSNETTISASGISGGIHEFYVSCSDESNWSLSSETRTIQNSIPFITYNSPENSSYINDVNSVSFNVTISDTEATTIDIWTYGDGVSINTSEDTPIGDFIYTWADLSLGEHNWSVIVNDGFSNSTEQIHFFNLINLTINCEAGGPYRQNARVLVQGNISDGISGLISQSINASLYKEGIFNISRTLISLSDGSFQTSFSTLADGNYTLNASFSYQGINKSCVDNFTIGGELTATSASFVLDKIISLQELTSTNITYNITLKTANKGGSSASSVVLADLDSANYNLGILTAGNLNLTSYLKTYQRNSTNYNAVLAIASVNGTDALLNNEISANSSEITIVVPATTANTSITLIKNAQYLGENTTSVVYNLSVEVINSGGDDLSGIGINDSDTDLNTRANLNRTQSYSASGVKTINKTSLSRQHNFSIANATYNSLTYQSNQISILIPALESNASLSLNKIASMFSSTETNITYNITLILANTGGRNATSVNITDADSADSPYSIENLTAGQTSTRSYLKTYNKSSLSSNQELAIANASGIDTISSNLINASSHSLSIFVPALEANASLLLSKSASLHLTNNTHIVYNITLSLTNKGGRNATNSYITDSNSTSSPYSIGDLTAGETAIRSYLQTFSRETYLTTQTLSIATANATDSISNNLIEANSSEITVTIPAKSSPASFVLNKIASFHNLTNETFTYNITLRLTNKGGSNATNSNITDSDYADYNFSMGTLTAEETATRSYLLNFTRNSTTHYNSTSIAQAFGIDADSGSLISANSSSIDLIIPSTEKGQQLTVIKSEFYNSQNSTSVNYTLTIQIVNSGGIDLTEITVLDLTDLGLSTTTQLNRTQSYTYSGQIIIEKAQSNAEKAFSIASATVNSVTYNSTQVKVLIPGYGGGPNDVKVYPPASVSASTSFNTIINITNQNQDIGQDFIITYWITSNDETVNYSSSGQQTIYILALVTNSTTATLTSPGSAGTYRLKASVSGAGISVPATSYGSFEVTVPATAATPSAGGGGSSITGKIIYEARDEEIEQGKTQALKDGEKVKFNIIQDSIVYSHSLEIIDLQPDRATIMIYSQPITIMLYIGEEKKLDLNEDGYYDLYVKLEKIENNNAHVYLKSIHEQAEEAKLTPEENKTAAEKGEIEETPEKSRFFENIKNAINSIGRFFSSTGESISQNKNYLFIGCGILIILAGIILLIKIVQKKKVKTSSRVTYKEKIKQNLKKIRNRHLVVFLFAAMLIGILSAAGNKITGFVAGNIANRGSSSGTFAFAFVMVILGLLILLYGKNIREMLRAKNKKYLKDSIKRLVRKKVYTEEGDFVGKIEEIILEKNKISSLKIKSGKKKRFKEKGVIVKYKDVKCVGHVVIIGDIFKHIEKPD